jgi:hypothetical protein
VIVQRPDVVYDNVLVHVDIGNADAAHRKPLECPFRRS